MQMCTKVMIFCLPSLGISMSVNPDELLFNLLLHQVGWIDLI
jgi:hypothetical protein